MKRTYTGVLLLDARSHKMRLTAGHVEPGPYDVAVNLRVTLEVPAQRMDTVEGAVALPQAVLDAFALEEPEPSREGMSDE